uniref:Putative conserved secreted protein n=1 Tax=Lutzomyia longipalpis TaxID=7200 RepID=A0A1B0GIJ3_LUTLO
MKTVLLCFLVVCALFALAHGQCETACPFIYSPICAGPPGQARGVQTFDNDCMLRVYNCQQRTEWIKYSDSDC